MQQILEHQIAQHVSEVVLFFIVALNKELAVHQTYTGLNN